jgi:hypothetical protein
VTGEPTTTMVLFKTAGVLALLGLALWACGAGWVVRWVVGMALGGLLVLGALLGLAAIL